MTRIDMHRLAATAILLLGISAAGQAAQCTRRNAERATVPQIASHPENYQGRCVAIDGVMQSISLFESVDGLYLQPPDGFNPASSGFRLGLDNIGRHFSMHYRHVAIIGRVQDCESTRELVHASDSDTQISFVSGYCHSFDGPYVWVHQLTPRKGAPFMRQMGRYSRKDYGDLEPAPADWPHRKTIEDLAANFLKALRAGDRDELANIHFRNVGLEWEDDEAELLRFLLKDRKSPFASIRQSPASPQQFILLDKAGEDVNGPRATVCFCRQADCTGRWPIASFDADNVSSRPYACTEIVTWLQKGRQVTQFSTPLGTHGLAEPPAR